MHIYNKPHDIRQGLAGSSNSLLHNEDDARPVIPEQQPARQASLPLRVQPPQGPHQGPNQPRTPSSPFPASPHSLAPLSRPAAPLPPRLSRTPPSSDSGLVVGGRSRKKRQRPGTIPVSFPRFFLQSRQTAVSVIPSTAEGKPFPLNDTSARQKLASTCPAGSSGNYRYAKSTGAESRTYSKPILVRTRSAVVPQYRRGTSSLADSSRVPLYQSPDIETGPRSGKTDLDTESNRNERTSSQGNQDAKGKKTRSKMSTSDQPENGFSSLPLLWERRSTSSRPIVAKSRNGKPKKLPPMDAFSFKSFMADMQAQGGENNIGADLDRIAEICARSRYSLSNQYEVHMAPHGSGAQLVSPTGGVPAPSAGAVLRRRDNLSYTSGGRSARAGPTLQAIVPDEEDDGGVGSRRRRRGPGAGGRRTKSIAYGTLETIMSSSRSSEEDRSSKKPAAEIAGEVRGRIENRHSNLGLSAHNAGLGADNTITHDTEHTVGDFRRLDSEDSQQKPAEAATASTAAAAKLTRKKSASFATAVMDSHSRSSAGQLQRHESSTSALVSEPALPQTSDSHLGVRTAAAPPSAVSDPSIITRPLNITRSVSDMPYRSSSRKKGYASSSSTRGSWNAWIPWKGGSGGAGSQQQQELEQAARVAEEFVPPMSAGLNEPERTVSHAEGSLRRILKSR
ncbi:hypothetical protein B0T20DRAFT_503329 [Sordaria brevicollis]|uniref:Uncharacterized protein n=1 Tax=Sordaria brevicollis TaxID=83679 RepID=A0AAE0PMW2_SORBR|nr:hypothetical protein B0T20DRAFT_503329 [Sordaria brevicollis]